ncbi:hypothetical protein KR767_15935 [Luteibacter anthropi]|uniref:hypothetical protein n=1 Tax=Luteibacter anthropi TaxID=564369 RepID=UPI002032F0F6|nr:hypothetical protein [Luteibacter anthropi]URX61541.1 hypothetical protein KR767_15935 [Luteibacter anthropi]
MKSLPLLLLCLSCLRAAAGESPGPVLGAHVLLGQAEGLGQNPATTLPMDTQASSSIFIAFNAGYADNASTPADNYGNRWRPLDAGLPYAGYDGAFAVRPYVALNGRGGPAHRLSVAKPGHPSGELSLSFVEVMHANRVVALKQNYAAPSTTVASDVIDVDGPAVLLAFWWGDGGVKRMDVVPDDGFQVIDNFTRLPDESGVQAVVAWKQVGQAGRYRVRWHVSPAQGAALWLIAIR